MTEEKKDMTAVVDENQKEKSEQILPDGIGLTIEEVRELIHKKHDTSIPVDDPVLMFITIMNATLMEQAKLQKVHEKALGKLMGEHTKQYIEESKEGMAKIMTTLSQLTTEGLNEAAKDMVKFKTTLHICTAISFISALLIVAVFVLNGA